MAGLTLDPEDSEELQQALALSLDSSDAQGDSNSKDLQALSSPFEDTASSAAPDHPSTSEGAISSSAAWTLVPHPDVPSALEGAASSSAADEVVSKQPTTSAAAGSSAAAEAPLQVVDNQPTSAAGIPNTVLPPSK